MEQTTPRKGNFGCLGYGCLIATLLMALSAAGIFWIARSGIRNAVTIFTSESPINVPALHTGAAELIEGEARVRELKSLLDRQDGAGQVVLGAASIATLLNNSHLNGKVFTTIEGDLLATQFSIPLRELGSWQAAAPFIRDLLDRHLTGSATASVQVDEGVIMISMRSLTLNHSDFDSDALKEATEWVTGFARSLTDDSAPSEVLRRISELRIREGKIFVTVTPSQPAPAGRP